MATTTWTTQIHTSKKFKLGTIKRQDGNEYIYVSGQASIVSGDFVRISSSTFAMLQCATTPTTGMIGVAMSTNASATTYSWAQVRGRYASANVTTHSSGAGKALFATGTGGRTIITPLTEGTIYGAFTDGDSASNIGPVILNFPQYVGDIST